jgi:hypothetical protein
MQASPIVACPGFPAGAPKCVGCRLVERRGRRRLSRCCDHEWRGSQLRDALRRAHAYFEAGADCVFPIALWETEAPATFIARLPARLTSLASSSPRPSPTSPGSE